MKTEHHYINQFGESFEVREIAHGRLFSRRIMRDPLCGWTTSWDEARASVDDAIRNYALNPERETEG